MKKIFTALSFIALFSTILSVQAKESRFQSLDIDNDGKVSVEEFTIKSKKKEKSTKAFVKLDANSDGFLSEDEMAKMKDKKNKKDKKKKNNEE
ncbi:EF-hand domain-containing protein [Pseudocolwellia sp. AS88]|uniref:EF-hand domain-containing protein n=1 Tax=Pseudocolwellia sp. AS88 TaxID=3063958 RepID=UPI0026F349DC|nr:EF-hand domain-containing protein [Pseudocolwellia sp. AS88]MDO7085585.1 EF-hand domain-containing protein [Pseudocolwellia sp. AS88]